MSSFCKSELAAMPEVPSTGTIYDVKAPWNKKQEAL
jgi:hypothetical protein